MKSGIYKIVNRESKKIYIGKSNNIERRVKEHKDSFKRKSCNYKFLECIDNYDLDIFDFEVLEYCKEDKLEEKEGHYIKKYNSVEKGYNIAKVADHDILFGIDSDLIIDKFINKLKEIKWKDNHLTLEVCKLKDILKVTEEQLILIIRKNRDKIYSNDMRIQPQNFNKDIKITFSVKKEDDYFLGRLSKCYD